MQALPKATIIIAVYNKVHYLRLLLAGLQRQTVSGFELILADDGSNPESVAEIEALIPTLPFPVTHLWQPDNGFQKNKIMNRAIAAARSEYLIFIDGDCIPHKCFVEEHLKNAGKGLVLNGRRVNLPEAITNSLTEQKVLSGSLERIQLQLLISAWGKGQKEVFAERGFYIAQPWLQRLVNRKAKGLLGSNFSLFKADMLAINGFDERYVQPSVGEDTDIEFRLRLLGMQFKTMKNVAVQYHLWHRLLPRPQENLDLYRQVEREGKAFTEYGIVKTDTAKG
ncbi:MAG: glycosyltransferase [Bacteroidota bacterium]